MEWQHSFKEKRIDHLGHFAPSPTISSHAKSQFVPRQKSRHKPKRQSITGKKKKSYFVAKLIRMAV